MKFIFVILLISTSFLFSCTNIDNEAEMVGDYCYCRIINAKDAAEKAQAKRNCDDLTKQVEKQHGKGLEKLPEKDKEHYLDVLAKHIEKCKK